MYIAIYKSILAASATATSYLRAQVLIEPLHGLQEGAFLCISSNRVFWVTSNSKAMLDAAVQIDLVGCTQRLQNLFGFMTFFCGEDHIGFGCGDCNRTCEGFKFIGINERWVSKVARINFTFFGVKMTDDIFGTEAIANSSDFLPYISRETCISIFPNKHSPWCCTSFSALAHKR